MKANTQVALGGLFVIAGCVMLLNSWGFINPSDPRLLKPIPKSSESQVFAMCEKAYKHYGYKLT